MPAFGRVIPDSRPHNRPSRPPHRLSRRPRVVRPVESALDAVAAQAGPIGAVGGDRHVVTRRVVEAVPSRLG